MDSLSNSTALNSMNRSYDYLFKLIIVGDSCVGKTCILQRFHGENFMQVSTPTIGIDFRIRTITIQNKVIKLQIWDTSGQEKYDSITTSYYRGAMGVLLVFDITNRSSFDHINTRWLKHINANTREGTKTILIGNKCDLNNKRQITSEMAEAMAINHGLKYFETSAKENINLDKAFYDISKDIFNEVYNEKNLDNQQKSMISLPKSEENSNGKRNYSCCQMTLSL